MRRVDSPDQAARFWRRLQEEGLESRLTFLLYLNDGFVGGETTFKTVAVSPARGSALLFVHESWHEGSAVSSGVKYVLRSDVLYGSEPA